MNTSFSLSLSTLHRIESANYVTNVNPALHPDRIMNMHDFLYIIDGEWEIIEDENVYNLESDDLLILTAGRHHYGTKPSSAGNKHMYIHMYPEDCQNICTICNEDTPDLYEKHNQNLSADDFLPLKTIYHCKNNPRIRQLFKDIIATCWSASSLKETKISLMLNLMACELSAVTSDSAVPTRNSKIVEQVTELIYSNPHSFYSCKEVASMFFVCERTLSNLFMKSHNVSFYNFQMNMKLEMVRQYLSDHPEALLCDVARNYGFYDEFHLGKAYKKKYGCSPKKHIKIF